MNDLTALRDHLQELLAIDQSAMTADLIEKADAIKQAQEDLEWAEQEYAEAEELLEAHRDKIRRARQAIEQEESEAMRVLAGNS